MTIAILSLLSSINPFSANVQTKPTGAEGVRAAVSEIESLQEKGSTAVLGEPQVVEESGQYSTDTKIVIPVLDSPYGGQNKLVFDLPESRNDDGSVFLDLLDHFGCGFENMEDIAGTEVPAKFCDGNVHIDWAAMENSDNGGKGSDKDMENSGNGGKESDKDMENSDKGGKESDKDEDKGGDVNVEKTVITSDDGQNDG